jgi:hypothetical protein
MKIHRLATLAQSLKRAMCNYAPDEPCCLKRGQSGLPDFSWYNIPKREKNISNNHKNTKWPQNTRNGS